MFGFIRLHLMFEAFYLGPLSKLMLEPARLVQSIPKEFSLRC